MYSLLLNKVKSNTARSTISRLTITVGLFCCLLAACSKPTSVPNISIPLTTCTNLSISGRAKVELLPGLEPSISVASVDLVELTYPKPDHISIQIVDLAKSDAVASKPRENLVAPLLLITCSELTKLQVLQAVKIEFSPNYTADELAELTHIGAYGRSRITLANATQSDLEIRAASNGFVEHRKIDADNVVAMASSHAQLNLAGSTGNLRILATGNSAVDALGLRSQNVEVEVKGKAQVKVSSTAHLIGMVGADGVLTYAGNPDTHLEVQGNGEVSTVD